MVMSPWNDPYPFTRAWCVFEAYCAVSTGSELEIAMSKVDEENFINDLRNHPNECVDEMLTTIRAEKSQCSIENDRKCIFEVIEKSVGFSKLDEMIFNRYWEWMIDVSKRAAQDCVDSDQSLDHLRTVGVLLQKQGKYKEAGCYLKEHLSRSKLRYGKASVESLVSMRAYGLLLRQQGKLKLAKKMLEDCLQSCEDLLGLEHPLSIECMRTTAEMYSDIGQYNSALKLFHACLGIPQERLSDDQALLLGNLRAMGSLAVLHLRMGNFEQAEKVAEDCNNKCATTVGAQHPLTIESNINLADTCILYPLQLHPGKIQTLWQKWLKGRHLHKNCLQVARVIFGDAHPFVKHSKLSLRFGSSYLHCKQVISGHASFGQFLNLFLTLPALVLAQIYFVTNDYIEALSVQTRRFIKFALLIILLPILFERFLHILYCECLPTMCRRNIISCNQILPWYYWIEDMADLFLFVPRSIRFLYHLPIVILNRGIAAIPAYTGDTEGFRNLRFQTLRKTYPYCEEYNISLLKQRYRHQGSKAHRRKAIKVAIAAIDDGHVGEGI